MSRLSPHFHSREFACKDGCGWLAVDPLLVVRLEQLRQRLGRPITIVSGRRCPVHNRRVGGAERSRHVHGDAADIPASLMVTERQARDVGFTGIGKNSRGWVVHVDVRPGKVIVWNY
jgi:zinc D-Ala-D-Ala carboxypeptidase